MASGEVTSIDREIIVAVLLELSARRMRAKAENKREGIMLRWRKKAKHGSLLGTEAEAGPAPASPAWLSGGVGKKKNV